MIIGGAKVEDKQPLIDKFLPIADKIYVGGKIASDGYKPNSEKIVVAADFKTDSEGNKLDISDSDTEKLLELVAGAKTIVWNGVLGKVEDKPFDEASLKLAEAIGVRDDLTSVICGGDTAGYVENLIETRPELKYSLVSTGGGASLELLSGLELPGLEALEDK